MHLKRKSLIQAAHLVKGDMANKKILSHLKTFSITCSLVNNQVIAVKEEQIHINSNETNNNKKMRENCSYANSVHYFLWYWSCCSHLSYLVECLTLVDLLTRILCNAPINLEKNLLVTDWIRFTTSHRIPIEISDSMAGWNLSWIKKSRMIFYDHSRNSAIWPNEGDNNSFSSPRDSRVPIRIQVSMKSICKKQKE